jgi:hypothetical protein
VTEAGSPESPVVAPAAAQPAAPLSPARQVGRRALGLFLLSAVILAGVGLWQFTLRQRHLQEYVTAREMLAEHVQSVVYAQEVLKMAARLEAMPEGNRLLAACVLGGGTCTTTDPEAPVSFLLRTGIAIDAPVLIGTDETPARISGLGKINCDAALDEACPGWDVRAWFWAECPDGAKACPLAKAVHVRYQIRGAGELASMPRVPADELLQADAERFARTVAIVARSQ